LSKVWNILRFKVCEGLRGFVKVCEALWVWVCEVRGLRCELFKLFKCVFWGFFVPSKFWCSWHCCCWWLLHSLKHSSNWSVYNFSGNSNNSVYNISTSTIDKVSLQTLLLDFMCLGFFYFTFSTLLCMCPWTSSN
jgi:hypothetical protein